MRDDLIALKQVAMRKTFSHQNYTARRSFTTLFDDKSLDLFVLFSSTSTDIAPAGQVDYVAANAFLNAYARSQATRTDGRARLPSIGVSGTQLGWQCAHSRSPGALRQMPNRTKIDGVYAERIDEGSGKSQL